MWIFQIGARGPILVFLDTQICGFLRIFFGLFGNFSDLADIFRTLASFVILEKRSNLPFIPTSSLKPNSLLKELGEKWWFQDWKLHRSAVQGTSATDPSQAANCECSYFFVPFHVLASWIQGRCGCSFFSYRPQVLSAFKQWNRHSRD